MTEQTDMDKYTHIWDDYYYIQERYIAAIIKFEVHIVPIYFIATIIYLGVFELDLKNVQLNILKYICFWMEIYIKL